MNNAAYNNTNNNTHNHTDNHTMLHWFYSFTARVRLTGTAQRLWHCLYYRMDGTATGRFCEIASTSLEDELGICRKTLQRARVALAKAGLIRCEVRGKSVYYMLLMPDMNNQTEADPSTRPCRAAQDDTQSKSRQTAVRNEVLNLSTSPCPVSLSEQTAGQHKTQKADIVTSHDYAASKPSRQPDILFNNKYEILLQDYLNNYHDNRFAKACFNHFEMVKELYQSRGKKALTEFGFHNIMQQLEQLTTDMDTKLAIMERSMRNRWAGFFPLPENTPEYKKQSRKNRAANAAAIATATAVTTAANRGRSLNRKAEI
ncbi:MAG: hypothetical protein IKU46_11025 [Peptococcaceae bacterium]|nr:hypothetical protein [Peptococcaceae bacterium]